MNVKKNLVSSEHKIFGLGLNNAEYSFFNLEQGETMARKSLYVHMVKWSSESQVYSRAIYTFWDLLGDVGGLFDMLKLIG